MSWGSHGVAAVQLLVAELDDSHAPATIATGDGSKWSRPISRSLCQASSHNFADIPLWDRLFGTYGDTTEFAPQCGFPNGAEEKLTSMLAFRDVYAG